MMDRDGRVDQVASERPKPSRIGLRPPRKPRIADDVGHQDRREFSDLAHGANAEACHRSRWHGHGCTSMLHEGTWKRSAAPRVDWPVYPRRAEHITVAEGGNRRWAEPCEAA